MTADPQYFADDSLPRTPPIKARADDTLRAVMWEFANGPHDGIVIAGDLTQFTRHQEFGWYKDAIARAAEEFRVPQDVWMSRLYDGLGNHDVEPWNRLCGLAALADNDANRPLHVLPNFVHPMFDSTCRDRRLLLRWVHDRQRVGQTETCSFTFQFGNVSGAETNKGPQVCPHYSWDWNGMHFVQLNILPARGVDGSQEGPPPMDALRFLRADLLEHVGNSGRPVVLIHHFHPGQAHEGDWWPYRDQVEYWDLIVNYNIAAIFSGHSEPGPGDTWRSDMDDVNLVQPPVRTTCPTFWAQANDFRCDSGAKTPPKAPPKGKSCTRRNLWADDLSSPIGSEPGTFPCIHGLIAGSAKGRWNEPDLDTDGDGTPDTPQHTGEPHKATWFDAYQHQTPGLFFDVEVVGDKMLVDRYQVDGDQSHLLERETIEFLPSFSHAPPQLSVTAEEPGTHAKLELRDGGVVPPGSIISWEGSGTARPLRWHYQLFRPKDFGPRIVEEGGPQECRALRSDDPSAPPFGDPLPTCTGSTPPLPEAEYLLTLGVSDGVGQSVAAGAVHPDVILPTVPTLRFTVAPALSIDDVTVTERDVPSEEATFTVSLAGAGDEEVSVDYATADGNAVAPADYEPVSGTLTFAKGETEKHVTVLVRGDPLAEGTESFRLVLSNPRNAAVAPGGGTGRIVDDPEPALAMGDVTLTESDSDSVPATFTVSLSEPNPESVSVGFQTGDMSAWAPGDYAPVAGTLSFDPGETQETVTVPVVGDVLDEGTEQFFVDLSEVQSATIGEGRGIATILDDPEPTLAVGDVRVVEGDGGTTAATFELSLTEANPTEIAIDFRTVDGRASPGAATAPDDYGASEGRLRFAPGDVVAQTTVAIVGDIIDEVDETFGLQLANAVNVLVSDAEGAALVVDDDRNGVFSCRASALVVGGAGAPGAVANPDASPCRDDGRGLTSASRSAGLTSATATSLEQRTELSPDDQTQAPAAGDVAAAASRVQSVSARLDPFTTIHVSALAASAAATCGADGGAPAMTSAGSTDGVTINGLLRVRSSTGHAHLPLQGGTLHLNHTIETGHSITRRALWFQSSNPLVADVVAGEASAGWDGTEAHPAGHPCSD